MIYSGIVVIRKEFEGSKSEGNCAYLDTGQTEYRLFRMSAFPVNDESFYTFDGKKAEIEGIVTDYWLSVEKISEIQTNNVAGVDIRNGDVVQRGDEIKTISKNTITTDLKEGKNEEDMS